MMRSAFGLVEVELLTGECYKHPCCLPSGGGAPGTAPSGTPAIPNTSTSMDSLPGFAKGTLNRPVLIHMFTY